MRTQSLAALLTLALTAGGVAPALAQDAPRRLSLTFEADGTVTLLALNVPVREILAEWQRQCGCHVVNATGLTEQIAVPMQFEHASQEAVLTSLLRRASGYALTPRREGMTGPSRFETIYIVPTSRASAAYTPPAQTYTPPSLPTTGSPADEIPPVVPIPTLPDPAAAQQNTPASTNTPAPRVPGTPTRFVPIVPVGGTGSSGGSQPAGLPPGGATAAPGRPTAAPGQAPGQ